VVQEIACLSREQAEAIVGAIAEVAGAEFVTRKDLALVRGALELPIERLRGELQRFHSGKRCFGIRRGGPNSRAQNLALKMEMRRYGASR
jgi:hypothetical protein